MRAFEGERSGGGNSFLWARVDTILSTPKWGRCDNKLMGGESGKGAVSDALQGC